MNDINDIRERRERERQERCAAAKKRRRKKMLENVAVGALGVLMFVSIFLAVVALGGLIFWLAWNLGVVPIVAALGGSVGEIGFWTAVGGSLAVGVIKSIFSGSSKVEVKK